MFIGHYAPAFVAKAAVKSVPLWVLFAAAQWVDFLWAAFVISGVEKMRVEEGFLPGSPLDLTYIPYSHGLPSAVLLSLLAGGIAALAFKAERLAVVAAVALTSFAHWVFDLVVHTQDLPLAFDQMKVGFGLWAYPNFTVPLEIGLMLGGLWLYDRVQPSPRRSGTIGLWVFGFAMAALQVYNSYFSIPPSDSAAFAQLSLTAFTVLVVLAGIVDFLRRPVRF